MAIQFKVDQYGAYMRHTVAVGQTFTGERTSNGSGRDQPELLYNRVLAFDENPANGEGLFEFEPFLRRTDQSVFVTYARIRVGTGVVWTLSITDGDEGGSAAEVDDPARDVQFDTGTGDAIVKLNMDLPPKSKIRISTNAGAVGAIGIAEVEFFPTLDKFDRVMN
jgi:hypothetical protein